MWLIAFTTIRHRWEGDGGRHCDLAHGNRVFSFDGAAYFTSSETCIGRNRSSQ